MQASRRARSYRETIPLQCLGAPGGPKNLPGSSEAPPSLQLPQDNIGMRAAYRKRSQKSLRDASFRAQKQAESFPNLDGIAPASRRRSLSELPPLGHFALEEQTRQKLQHVPPPTQLEQLDLAQLRAEVAHLQKIVQQLAGQSFSKQKATNNNNNNIDNSTTNNNNTNDNNDNDNNTNSPESSLQSLDHSKESRESGLNSFDLDNENPESSFGSDLERLSLDSFAQDGETGFSSSDHQGEASSLTTLGETMTIGFSLGNLTQRNQKGMIAGTTWDPSLGMDRDSFEKKKQKKKVTFSTETLAAYKARNQNNRQQSSQLRQLEHNNEYNNNNNNPQAWQNRPSMMQQQSATASEKELEHMQCTAGSFSEEESLEEEDRALGSFEAQPQATTTSLPACRFPKHNNNISILGLDLKNKAAWGILIDIGAAMSLAPVSFAPEAELSPLESTLQLRNLEGRAITAYGRRTVELRGPQLSFTVSFVIADVEHVSLGMDFFEKEKLSMIRSNNNEIHLVNIAGAKTKLQQKGHLLYVEACSDKLGLSTSRGSSFQQDDGSLLNDKDGTQQDATSNEELASNIALASGGALGSRFPSDNLRQQDKNTTSLGATALPTKGAKKRNKKKKKPSAKGASHNKLDENSSKQKGQDTATAQLRSLEKTSLIEEIELAAAKVDKESLSKIDQQELSLRILLILSLRFRWQITTTRATDACSEDALGQQLRNIGLDQNSINSNIFSGDELVVMLCQNELLITGTEIQQEDLFLELSALIALDQTTKLAQSTQVSLGSRTLEYHEASNSISMSLPQSFWEKLWQRHQLEDAELTTSLQQEELCQDASGQYNALDASRQKLYQQTVGELVLAAACRPDLCFEVHLLTQSFEAPTTEQEMQLHKVLRYLKGTSHYTLSLHPTTKKQEEKAQSLELLAFTATAWTDTLRSTSAAYMTLWGAPLVASCKTSCANNQQEAELQSVRLALGLACHTKMLLQQLGVDKLEQLVDIRLKTSSFQHELVTGRPLAMQLGLSRRHKHIELQSKKGQLHLSKVHPEKNLAHSLIHNASAKRMLAKLRVLNEAAKIGALSTALSQNLASLGSSSSLVGVVIAEPPAMENQLRQLALRKSDFANLASRDRA